MDVQHSWRRCAAVALVAPAPLVLGSVAPATAQTPATQSAPTSVRWTIDPTTSLVWWQIDPHFGHLWATSCPEDPSWQPGEGRSPGYYVNMKTRPDIKVSRYKEGRIPLFPRITARPLCRQAVSGTLQIADRATYRGVTGEIAVISDSLTMGSDHRDIFMRKFVLKPTEYPNVRFKLDSLSNVQPGDTLKALAHGTFFLRGTEAPYTIAVTGVPEKRGMRIRGKFAMTADDLTGKFGVSKVALGAGVGLQLWETLHMGFDVIFKLEGEATTTSSTTP